MIKFFRHIRQRLLSQNRFSKYLLYALGEILLVVIGILIALQVNNWNEIKKNRKIEIGFFQDVLGDLEKDKLMLQDLKVFYQNRIDQLGWLLDAVRNPVSNPDIVEFGKYVEPLYYNLETVEYSSTYEAAKNSGYLAAFSNKEIIKELTQFYSEFSTVEGILRSTISIIEVQLEPIMATIPENYLGSQSRENVLAKMDYDNSPFYEYLDEIGDTRNINIDLKAFLRKPEFENYLIGDLGRCFNGMQVFKKRKEQIEKIKTKITNLLNDPSI